MSRYLPLNTYIYYASSSLNENSDLPAKLGQVGKRTFSHFLLVDSRFRDDQEISNRKFCEQGEYFN